MKKILKSLLSIMVVFSALFTLTGCSSVKIKFDAHSDYEGNFIQVYTATKGEDGDVSSPNYIGSFQFNGKSNYQKVEKGSYVVLALDLMETMYEIDTFKVLKDGEEVVAIPNYGKDDGGAFTEEYLYLIGEVDDTVKITFEGKIKLIEN